MNIKIFTILFLLNLLLLSYNLVDDGNLWFWTITIANYTLYKLLNNAITTK